MKLLRWGTAGQEKPGLLDPTGTIRDLSGILQDIDAHGLAPDALARIASLDPLSLPAVPASTRLGPPVAGVGKIICVGLNYMDHAREAGMTPPEEPVLFMKATSSIAGPHDPLELPVGADAADWEVELGLVIGQKAKRVAADQALDYLAGYCLVNDISERHWQKDRGGQWVKGKSADGFAPLGPWLVTRDAIPDPQALALTTELNGQKVQDGNTADMIHKVKDLVAYISTFMTLHPGDIISTGTPAGVGMGMKPPRYLRGGDILHLSAEGLGEQRQEILAPGI